MYVNRSVLFQDGIVTKTSVNQSVSFQHKTVPKCSVLHLLDLLSKSSSLFSQPCVCCWSVLSFVNMTNESSDLHWTVHCMLVSSFLHLSSSYWLTGILHFDCFVDLGLLLWIFEWVCAWVHLTHCASHGACVKLYASFSPTPVLWTCIFLHGSCLCTL